MKEKERGTNRERKKERERESERDRGKHGIAWWSDLNVCLGFIICFVSWNGGHSSSSGGGGGGSGSEPPMGAMCGGEQTPLCGAVAWERVGGGPTGHDPNTSTTPASPSPPPPPRMPCWLVPLFTPPSHLLDVPDEGGGGGSKLHVEAMKCST